MSHLMKSFLWNCQIPTIQQEVSPQEASPVEDVPTTWEYEKPVLEQEEEEQVEEEVDEDEDEDEDDDNSSNNDGNKRDEMNHVKVQRSHSGCLLQTWMHCA